MKKVLLTLSDRAHAKLVAFQRKNDFTNMDTAVEAMIEKVARK